MLGTEGWLRRDSPHMRTLPPLPARVGPAEFGELGRLVAVRAPRELDDIFRRAGGTWEPGSRRWLIERRRIGPVIRALRRRPLSRAPRPRPVAQMLRPIHYSGERAFRWTN